MNPLISIIITNYNYGKYLNESVNSVLNQIYQNFEIIIVDDKSIDNSINIIKELELKDSRIKSIFHEINKKTSAARNTGIKNSIGKYIVPLDADDILKPLYLKKCVELIETNIADIVYTDSQYFGTRNTIMKYLEYDFNKYKRTNQFPSICMYHKKHWEEIGGYNEILLDGYEDWEFGINMGKHKHFGKRIPEVLFLYRQKEMSRNIIAIKKEKEIWEIISKIHPEMKR